MVTRRQLLFMCFLALTIMPGANCRNLGDTSGGGGGGGTPPPPPPPPPATPAEVTAFFNQVNQVRVNILGLKKLALNPKLTQAAQAQAQDMVANSYSGKVGPPPANATAATRASALGVVVTSNFLDASQAQYAAGQGVQYAQSLPGSAGPNSFFNHPLYGGAGQGNWVNVGIGFDPGLGGSWSIILIP